MKTRAYALVSLTIVAGLSVTLLADAAIAQRPTPIPAGDCQSMAAATGGKGLWFGRYSGQAQDQSSDRTWMFAGSGCFKSEYECRRWTHEMMSAAGGFPGTTSCRPYR